jgi:hypothetical protein
MNNTKYRRAIKSYIDNGGFGGSETVRIIFDKIPESIISSLSGKCVGEIMAALYKQFHAGKTVCQAEIVDDCVWIGGGVNFLLPLAAAKSITTCKGVEDQTTHYMMNYTEKF